MDTEAKNELHEKALRLTEALYRTTDLLSDAEPLKWSLRESGLKILSAVSCAGTLSSYDDLKSIRDIEKTIDQFFDKLHLATGGTFIARKNFDVLEQEYRLLQEKIVSNECVSLPTQKPKAALEYKKFLQTDISDNRTPGAAIAVEQKVEQEVTQRPEVSKGFAPLRLQAKSLEDRKVRLVELLREKGPSGIGDLTRFLDASISEKTVQRELNALVIAGVAKKEGEKRWRRYFL